MNKIKLAVAALSLTFLCGTLAAGDVRIVANPSVGATEVSVDDLKGIFLSTKSTTSDGSHVVPVLEKAGAAHEAFLSKYVGKSDSGLQMYYRSLVFTGKGSLPKTLTSDAEVVAYVAKTKGAIGYVGADAATAGVKVLAVK